MKLENILILHIWYFILKFIRSEDISISPYLNAFKIYQKQSDFSLKSFAFINPAVHNFNLTTKLEDDIKDNQFIKSDFSVSIHTERHQYYDLDKTDSYTINTICKFDYIPEKIYLFRNICCRITIQDFNFTSNDFYSIKFCKFSLSRQSSACFIDLMFQKSFIPKPSSADHFYFGLRAFAVATNSDHCTSHSDDMRILAVSRLYPLSFSNGLSVFWTNIFQSSLNFSLEIGRPFYSLDPDSFASFPIRLISDQMFSQMKLKCTISENLDIKSVFFDENIFDAQYKIATFQNQFAITILLENKGTNYQKSSQWWVDRGLLLFVMYGRLTDSYMMSRKNDLRNAWANCQITSLKLQRESKSTLFLVNKSQKIPIAINTGKFTIIPILKTKYFFSIFNEIDRPISLEDSFITLYSIHDVIDGSFVDVTNSAICDSIDKSSIICPPSMMKSSDKYFDTKFNKLDTDRTRILPNKFDLILEMKTWKTVLFAPINLWVAQNWKLDVNIKVINKINGWRVPVRSLVTREIICVTMFQRSRLKVLARLVNRNALGEKEFYGNTQFNGSPFLDITSQIQKKSIEFSPTSKMISYDDKLSDIIVDPQSAINDFDVRLWSVNSKRLLAIERIKIRLDKVFIANIKAFCVSSLDLFQDKSDIYSNYRQLHVEYTFQNDTKKMCYLFIVVRLSDLSEIRLDEIPSNYYRAFITQYDYSSKHYIETPFESSRYIPYSNRLNISIYESNSCSFSKLIFTGFVRLNIQYNEDIQTTSISSTIIHTEMTSTNPITANTNQIQNRELMKNLSSLYYGLYALIALVSLVALIVLVNCLVKFNYRKISHQSSSALSQPANNKLLNSAQPAVVADASSPTTSFTKHPPLLPPPGPLRNASNSEVELASSTFWSNCSSQDSSSFANRKYSSTLLEPTIPISPLNNFLIRTSPLVSSVYTNTKYRNNPSPSSDQGDGGYLSGENQSKITQIPLLKKLSDDRNTNLESVEITSNSSGLSHYTEAYPVPPPCPPLKWSIQWATSMVSAIPVFSQSYTSNLMTDSTCVISRAAPCGEPTSPINQWITNKTIPSSVSVPYTKSIDNLCEKSSGLGSLTSTQQEDYSMLSDDDNYHVSINSDKEHYRKYFKKC